MALLESSLFLYGCMPLMLVICIAMLYRRQSSDLDPREPPLVKPDIPVIGHLTGMLRYQKAYYSMLSKKNPFPMITIKNFNSRVYIVADPDLAQATFKHKEMDYEVTQDLGLRSAGVSPEAREIIRHRPADPKALPYREEGKKIIHETLAPGPGLNQMNARMLNKVALSLNGICDSLVVDDLYLWVRNMFTAATCSSLFGEHDPFSADPSLIDTLWEFDENFILLIIGNPIIARKGIKARAVLRTALLKYLEAGYDRGADASSIVREREEFARRKGIVIHDRAAQLVLLPFASTANAIPSVYWMIVYVFSDPDLVEKIRNEVLKIVTITGEGADRNFSIDITRFNSDCPLLVSAYQEVIRLTNSAVTVRGVKNDMILSAGEHSYFLKKGAMVQALGAALHSSDGWGPDVHKFNARRFLKSSKHEVEGNKEVLRREKAKRNAYMPYGGGKHLCPGRHFAFAEILGMTTALALVFRLTTKEGSIIRVVEEMSMNFGESAARPIGAARDFGIKLVRREGMERATFEFKTES